MVVTPTNSNYGVHLRFPLWIELVFTFPIRWYTHKKIISLHAIYIYSIIVLTNYYELI